MASTTAAAGAAPAKAQAKTKASNPRWAALRADRYRLLQLILFAMGAVLMPFGILAIALGWYGTAHSHYDYDQRTYLISGGILGLGLTILGGFLYFGAWLAKVAADQRDSAKELSAALTVFAQAFAGQNGASNGSTGSNGATATIDGSTLVFAGDGTTVHRRDCPLIAHRDDLRPVTSVDNTTTTCRVCRPDDIV